MTGGKWMRSGVLLLAVSTLAACAAPLYTGATGDGAKDSYDGLVRVANTRIDKVWVRPGIDLSGYTRVMPVITDVQYVAVEPGVSGLTRRFGQEFFALSTREKSRFEEMVGRVFAEEFAGSARFGIAEQRGPGVLVARVTIQDVRSRIPPHELGRERIYLRILGDARLVLELHDADSDELLARMVDRREFAYPGDRLSLATPGLSEAQVRSGVRSWAALLVRNLDAL